MAIGSAVLVAGWLGVATTSMMAGNQQVDAALSVKQAELARMQTQLQAMKSETAALKGNVAARADMLEARQAFLAALLTNKADLKQLAKMLPRQSQGDSLVQSAAADLSMARDLVPATKLRGHGRKTVAVAIAAAPVANLAEPFRQLENQQLAFVDKATGAAEARLRETRALISRLGLDPNRFVQASDFNAAGGVGGPYIPVSMDAEPRFKDLFVSWKKLSVLQAAVAAIPAYVPVKSYSFTSGFGVRYDPFNGGAAMHAGLDMAGSMGEPIYAAADGKVGLAGRANGYGNVVELEHGKGIETRYGHLSKILVTAGQTVHQGDMIGRMGSTGRSTGTHLHYEIRVDGRAVNPRPFLDASAFVLAAQNVNGGTGSSGFTGPIGPQTADADDITSATTIAIGGMTPIPNRR